MAVAVDMAGVLMVSGRYVEVAAGEGFHVLLDFWENAPETRRRLIVSSGAMIRVAV